MTAQVIYLPGWRQVSEEELERLDNIQDALSLAHLEFEYETRDLPEMEKRLRKEMVYLKARQFLGIVRKKSST